jgi:hypothetical protein
MARLAFGEARAVHGHREGVAGGRHLSGDVLLDLADASGRKLDLTLRVADLPTNSLWSSTCAARRRSSRAISASRPAFCIRRGSPDAIAFAMANWFA